MIQEQQEFQRCWQLLTAVFHHRQRLPNQVFRKNFAEFAFAELDWAMSADFWCTLQGLAARAEKPSVLVAVLEPDPVDYFYREFGCYNFFTLPMHATSDDYWAALEEGPASSSTDAALYNSDVIIWMPESLEWAIWGQRDIGTCVIGLNRAKSADGPALSRDWMSVECALTGLISMNFRAGQVPQEFSATLRVSYAGC